LQALHTLNLRSNEITSIILKGAKLPQLKNLLMNRIVIKNDKSALGGNSIGRIDITDVMLENLVIMHL
jgi:hypothetical protein